MVSRHYEWTCGGILPLLQRHSEVKHALLRDYLIEYFLTLVSSPQQDKIRITIVDGFCGGGRYINKTGEQAPGSPIVILRALKEAEARIHVSQKRKKPIQIDAELICVDEDEQAIKHLRWVLEEEGYEEQLRNEQIRLLTGKFSCYAEAVIRRCAERSKRSGKALFVLDQYGYSEVPLGTLREIFTALGKAEIILTFNVDSLINFLSDKNLEDFEKKTGYEGALSAADLDDQRKGPHWRHLIQAKLYAGITTGSGAKHFTPFFIRPQKGHGDFWLLHLSQHSKARDVMAETHWRHNNHFVHYGDAGLDMFEVGYVARLDDIDSPQTVFEFDDMAANRSHGAMLTEIPRILSVTHDGVRFQEFFVEHCNRSPATRSMIEKATLELVQDRQIEVISTDGRMRRVTAAIQDDDIVRVNRQQSFFFKR